MRKFLSLLMVAAMLSFSSGAARAAEESNIAAKRTKIVVKSALYGFGGGLVVGLASQVFKRKTKNIFMFGSLGMYAGVLLGIYVISTSSSPQPYEGPDTYEDFSSQRESLLGPLAKVDTPRAPELKMNLVSVEF